MQPIEIITCLKDRFSPAEVSLLICALRQDQLVWDSVQNEEFLHKVLNQENVQVDDWNPANLAFLHLGFDLKAAALQEIPLRPVENSYRRMATVEYQQYLQKTEEPASLESAGLLALALRERRRVKGSWDDLAPEIFKNNPETEFLRWRTPLACLVTIIPDPVELLSEISQDSNQELIQHILLANPLTSERKAEILANVIGRNAIPVQVDMLDGLKAIGQVELANLTAHHLAALSQSEKAELPSDSIAKSILESEQEPIRIENLADEIKSAEYYLSLGDTGKAEKSLARIQNSLHLSQAFVALKQVENHLNTEKGQDSIPTLEKLYKNFPDSAGIRTTYANALLEQGRRTEADHIVHRDTDDLSELILAAGFEAGKPDHSKASEFILKAYGQTLVNPRDISPSDAGRLIETLSDLGFQDEALDLVDSITTYRPTDPILLLEKSRLEQKNNRTDEAKISAVLSHAAAPSNLPAHRWLADLYEMNDEDEDSLHEREEIILHPESAVDDYISLAKIAFKTGDQTKVIDTCSAAIQRDPNCGQAHLWTGKALLQNNHPQEAIDQFTQAVRKTPEEEEAWLLLAHLQRETGLKEDASSTLKAAITAVPLSADLHFSYGEILQEQGTSTDALVEFSRASELDPQNKEIASAYGSSLFNLGRFEEAEKVLENVIGQYPDDQEIAYVYAKTLVAQDKHKQALVPLRVSLSSQPESIEPYIQFAESGIITLKQSSADENPFEGEKDLDSLSREIHSALGKSIELNPDHIQANMLSGDLHLFQHHYKDALERYSHAAELYQGGNSKIKCQINYGLGRSALGLERYDVALAALEEAGRLDPHQPQIQRDLAKAYQQANLPDAAMQTAHNAISLDPNNSETMVWFSNFCMEMKQDTEAIDAIRSAIQLMPENPDLRLQLGKLLVKKGDQKSADETYKGILDIESLPARILNRLSRIFETNGNLPLAILSLERLLKENSLPEIEIYHQLLKDYRLCGDPQAAIQTADKGLVCYPDDVELNTSKVDLLVETNQFNDAIESMEAVVTPDMLRHAGDIPAEKRILVVQMGMRHAYVSRYLGRLIEALSYSKNILKMTQNHFEALYLTADIEHALLRQDDTFGYLHDFLNLPGEDDSEDKPVDNELIHDQETYDCCICLLAEQYLTFGKFTQAANLVNTIENTNLNDWVSAIKSRIAADNHDFQKAHKLLDRAFKALNHGYYHPSPEISEIQQETDPVWNRTTIYYRQSRSANPEMAVAQAALSLNDWEKAITLLEKTVEDVKYETLPKLNLARAIILRAEFEQDCIELDVVQNSAGRESLSDTAYELVDQTLQAIDLPEAKTALNQWRLRAKICFHPDAKSIEAYKKQELDGDEIASLIAGATRTNAALDLHALSEKYPTHAGVQFQIAMALREINPGEALDAVKVALRELPVQPLYNALQSYIQKNSGNLVGAIQSMNDALDQWPEEHRWHAFLSKLYEEFGELDKAIEQLQQASEIDPLNFVYLFDLAKLFFEQGDLTSAQKKAKEAVLADPDDPQPWLFMAEIDREEGHFDDAISDAERAITLSPNDIEPLTFSAQLSLEADMPLQALDRAQAALRINPSDTDANLVYIKSLVAIGKEDEAISVIDTAVLESPDPLPVLIEKSAILKKSKGNSACLDLLDKVSKNYPDDPRVAKPLAEALADDGQVDEALSLIQSALLSDPDDDDLHLYAGRLLRTQGQLDQAIDHLSKCILTNPAGIDAYLELGRTYTDRRELSKAIEVYKQAVISVPDDYRPYYLAALCQREIKNYRDAEKLLKKASELAPDNVNIRRQLGAIIALNLVHKPKEVPVEL